MISLDSGIESSPEVEQYALSARENLSFDERYKEICFWVEKRRRRIDLQNLPWDDVRQLLLIRVARQYDRFDPEKGEFRRWVNTVISNEIRNIWRDWYSHMARPCVTGKGGCTENMGGNLCRRTASGVQCAECPAYREWEEKKGAQYAIMHPVSLELPNKDGPAMERPEVHTSGIFVDYTEMEKALHAKMKKRLTKTEWRAYKMLIIQHKESKDVARALGFKEKPGKKQRMHPGYLAILAWKHRFEDLARQIVAEEGLAA